MEKITFDYSKSLEFLGEKQIMDFQERVNICHNMVYEKTGKGHEFLGWVDLPQNYDRQEFHKIKASGEKIQKQSDVFIVVGIGGSYLGSRAAIEMLSHTFYNEIPREKRKGPKIYFAGHNLSGTYIKHLLDVIDGQDLSINIISKSGTTTEPALVFRILKEYMENKYGKEEASKRIYATTDKTDGALRALADKEGYETFLVPDDIGGRYSLFTSVGLLPMAVAGIDIEEIMKGAQAASIDLANSDLKENPSYQYAVIRNILYSLGKTKEIMVNYEPKLFYFGQWFIQLFGESEGKNGQGIFPSSLSYTSDLHSMGQYIQDGRKDLFQTILKVKKAPEDIIIKAGDDNLDGLNYLEGKTINFVNKKAMEATLQAHLQGGVPNLIINIPEITPYYFAYLAYFFKKACAMSGYLQGINPFDQPGVEAYKRNMFKLLGKPAYKEI